QSFVVDNPNTQNTTLYLYNTQGNLVLQQNLPLGTNYININYLPNGVYIAKMISNTHYWATKVVKID
ncbi:MAG: T9SS type A sorting domain-containing protein, partial [Chitinophagales bacterium]|nr:T9SS type A sorting domain-containing protein [Chitinophagales bacterium]